ncbi:exported hypothetical protein [Vibrio nigripulchritudo MADA3029]|nr:exported hypothetical protein [Vibrio nigripulchritudo MADA3020]CCN51826.1 exported hypothetical protein [Vibrio nigripulchritudo MADA3021]CCN61989.1 exported hypothetical protein [Vibrio nigripulchritudo MADA3029]
MRLNWGRNMKFKSRVMTALALAISTLCGSHVTQAEELIQGTDYRVVTAPVKQDDDVRVYFSFRCGHCATLDHIFAEVSNELAGDACVKKVILFDPKDKLDVLHAKGLAVAESHGLEKKYTSRMFTEMRKGSAPQCLNTMTEFFGRKMGIEPMIFQKQFLSQETNKKVDAYLLDANRMGITAVPSVIVGNQYQVIPQRVTSFSEYKDLIKKVVDKNLSKNS